MPRHLDLSQVVARLPLEKSKDFPSESISSIMFCSEYMPQIYSFSIDNWNHISMFGEARTNLYGVAILLILTNILQPKYDKSFTEYESFQIVEFCQSV